MPTLTVVRSAAVSASAVSSVRSLADIGDQAVFSPSLPSSVILEFDSSCTVLGMPDQRSLPLLVRTGVARVIHRSPTLLPFPFLLKAKDISSSLVLSLSRSLASSFSWRPIGRLPWCARWVSLSSFLLSFKSPSPFHSAPPAPVLPATLPASLDLSTGAGEEGEEGRRGGEASKADFYIPAKTCSAAESV